MVFTLRKRVGRRYYLYRIESYRDKEGQLRSRILEYLGPEDPIYGQQRGALRELNDGRGRSPAERAAARKIPNDPSKAHDP